MAIDVEDKEQHELISQLFFLEFELLLLLLLTNH